MSINYRIILRILGVITVITGLSMIPSMIVSFLNDSEAVFYSFLFSSIPLTVIGFSFVIYHRNAPKTFKIRDGYFVVATCWVLASLLGALPYYLSGVAVTYADAIFESTAAFTTTGCTIMDNSTLPMGIILWKATTHWLGGMGILIFAISILPALGISGLKLASAESPGPTFNKVKTKLADSTKLLYLIYVSLTVSLFVLLSFSKMSTFDAVVNTLGCISTSGLASNPGGIAAYDSIYIEFVITLFTLLASINFMMYYFMISGRWESILQDVELKAYALIILGSVSIIGMSLYLSGTYSSILEAFRMGLFQAVSFSTTAGYSLADYTQWPTFTQVLLFLLMCIGGCAASTCGSFKVIRLIVLIKLISRGFRKRLHPRSVVAVRLGNNAIPAETVSSITVFAMFYFAIFLFTSLVISLDNLDITTTLTTSISVLSNTGIAFGELGPAANFSIYSSPMRLFLSFMMIVGRLELFTVLIILTPYFWSREI